MRRNLVPALGLAVLVPLGSLATAAVATAAPSAGALQIGSWSGGPQFDSRSRQFERCTASLNNGSGTTLTFSIDRNFRWGLGFSNPSWSFGRGHSFGVILTIGKQFQIRQTALAVGVDRLDLQLDDSLTVFARLRVLPQLKATAGGMVVSFELRDSEEIMSALARCALQQTLPAPARPVKSKNPPRPADPLQAIERSDAMRAEASEIASDLLSFANIRDARVLANNQTPDDLTATAHAIWRTGHVVGTVSIVPAARSAGLAALATDLVRYGSAKCTGRFFVAAMPDQVERVAVLRLFTSCQAEPATSSIHHTLVARAAGGIYLLTVMIDRVEYIGAMQGSAEDLDDKIRTVLPGVVARAAAHHSNSTVQPQDAEPQQVEPQQVEPQQ